VNDVGLPNLVEPALRDDSDIVEAVTVDTAHAYRHSATFVVITQFMMGPMPASAQYDLTPLFDGAAGLATSH
jgi:hypothetical protein